MHEPLFLSVDSQMLKPEERILVGAMKVFAEIPPQIATIRQIADEAGVSFSAITYYFKTKENLYREVISRILKYVITSTPLKIGENEIRRKPRRAAALEELNGAVSALVSWIYGNSNAAVFAKIILREHFSPSPVYEMLYEGYFKKIIGRLTILIMAITPRRMKERDAAIQAFTIIGQVLAFRFEREMLVRHLNFAGFTPKEVEELKRTLMRNIYRQLEVEP